MVACSGEPKDHQIGGRFFIPPWNIDAVLNEKLVSQASNASQGKRLNLKAWQAVAKLLNTYNGLANVEGVKDFESDEIIAAMPRLFWPQYDWQIGFENMFRIGRAWHVYATPEGKKAFKNKHAIELEIFLKIAFAIYASTKDKPAVRPSVLASLGVHPNDVSRTLAIIGGTFPEQAAFAQKIRDAKIPRDFRRSVVKERPLFLSADEKGALIFVPSREFLLLRITDGLYFDVVQDPNARRCSGAQFEGLCQRMVQHYLGATCLVERERQTSYGDSADLFITDPKSRLSIIAECKIRRLPQRILTAADPWTACEDDFGDVIKGIVQIWRTHSDLTSSEGNEMVGVVLLYDPWTALGNAFIQELFKRAHQDADSLAIPEIHRIPVALAGFADFEKCVRSYPMSDVHNAVTRSIETHFHGYHLSSLLSEISARAETRPTFDYSDLAKAAVPWFGQQW